MVNHPARGGMGSRVPAASKAYRTGVAKTLDMGRNSRSSILEYDYDIKEHGRRVDGYRSPRKVRV